jgi:hypothetical protein
MFVFLKSTQKEEFFDTHNHIFIEKKLLYSRRGHSELLNRAVPARSTLQTGATLASKT